MSELRPCPFCGGCAEIMGDNFCYVECVECDAGYSANHEYDNDKDATAEKWNTRASDKLIEQLEKDNKELKEFALSLQLDVSNEIRLERLLEQLTNNKE